MHEDELRNLGRARRGDGRERGSEARPERDHADVVEADEGDEETDAHGERVLERPGQGGCEPAAHAEHGEQGEGRAGEEDDQEREQPRLLVVHEDREASAQHWVGSDHDEQCPHGQGEHRDEVHVRDQQVELDRGGICGDHARVVEERAQRLTGRLLRRVEQTPGFVTMDWTPDEAARVLEGFHAELRKLPGLTANVGVIAGGPPRGEETAAEAEVYSLYVYSWWRGRGVGEALMGAAFSDLAAQGRKRVGLWALSAAEGAQRFYRRLGGVDPACPLRGHIAQVEPVHQRPVGQQGLIHIKDHGEPLASLPLRNALVHPRLRVARHGVDVTFVLARADVAGDLRLEGGKIGRLPRRQRSKQRQRCRESNAPADPA